MALIQINRRCKECERSHALLREVRAEMDQLRLDYHSLYEKVRVNLAKLSKRADAAADTPPESVVDPLAQARTLLLQRKLNRG